MQTEETTPVRDWLSVDEAFVACQQAGLDRTKKTIRSWCRNEHLEAQKQSTSTGERWMVESSSLGVKIRSELEFQRHDEPVLTGAYASEPVQAKGEPVRPGADAFEQEQTAADMGEPDQGRVVEQLAFLQAKLQSLEVDKAVRDQHIAFLSKQNETGQQGLLSQSRYIGHLETQVMQLGGKPDQRFLEAPIPTEGEMEFANPMQEPLRPVQ